MYFVLMTLVTFYNGGNDSADTALKISEACKKLNYDLNCCNTKTVDNDLAVMIVVQALVQLLNT